MAPALTFKFSVHLDNPAMIPELMARTKDLRPVFDDIVVKWARNNREKFARSEGGEAGGSQVDPSVYWQGLKESTMRAKRRYGYPDHLMVETGDLERSLEDPEGFFHESTALQAAFGSPKALEDEMKVRYNWQKRPAVFLGLADQKAIEADIINYLSFGGDFKNVMFDRGLSNVANKAEAASMDMEFADTVGVVD